MCGSLTLKCYHLRANSSTRRHSYKFIEQSIRNGILEDLEDHVVGPQAGTVRSIGSTVQPAKGSRNKFTQDDDRILWQWVQNTPQKYGGTDGNEIYKQLEAQVRRPPAISTMSHRLSFHRIHGIHGSLGEIDGLNSSKESHVQLSSPTTHLSLLRQITRLP